MKYLHSIRLKLTAWYTLILGITLFGFGATAYLFTQENLLASLDYSLRNEVVWLKNFIEPQARKVKLKQQRPKPSSQSKKQEKKVKRSHEVEVTEADSVEFDQIWNQIYEHTLLSPKKQIIQIRDRNGDILYKSYSLGKEDIIFEDIPYNTTKLVTIYDAQGQPLRLAVTQNAYVKIFVAYPEAEISEVLGNLFSIFVILVPVALILSVLGGWFLANKSLKPVDKITRTARDITAQNLDQRILRGLQLRVPGLMYAVVQETGLAEASDPALLEWAAQNQYVLVTHDRGTMLNAAHQRMRSEQRIAGLVIVKKELPLARAIEDLVLLLECSGERDTENQVVFIPL